ncbi:hypothetical protein GCM10011415_23150 [Salipiger pallidus]|uniref:Uncharacterized protein n=1 Tax=Salipiger pallidus TaxID=1775170 RepID=A0A8J2ZKJ8_9RHOB|nr:hypothetical protein GCM10011415_23150 [Salipiger pallidus]
MAFGEKRRNIAYRNVFEKCAPHGFGPEARPDDEVVHRHGIKRAPRVDSRVSMAKVRKVTVKIIKQPVQQPAAFQRVRRATGIPKRREG